MKEESLLRQRFMDNFSAVNSGLGSVMGSFGGFASNMGMGGMGGFDDQSLRKQQETANRQLADQ
jgi:hypothetical protein